MRGLSLAGVVAVTLLLTLPASARTFRTDLNACNDPNSFFGTVCWGGAPSGPNFVPPLPTGGETVFTPSSDGPAPPEFSTSSFDLVAFDYAQFVLDNAGFFAANTIAAPFEVVSHGLSRPDSAVDHDNGTPWTDTANDPLLRINWFFDIALLPMFSDLFEDVQTVSGVNYFGVQLIFDGQGFELNGLMPAGMAYSRSFTPNGDEIWNGASQPCATFTNAGVCAASVPEPSSIALIGPGLLALVAAVRMRRRPARRFA